MKDIAQRNALDKQKMCCLEDRIQRQRNGVHKRASLQEKDSTKVTPRYLEVRVVPEQPSLRIRRTSLTNGAVMLYDGEM